MKTNQQIVTRERKLCRELRLIENGNMLSQCQQRKPLKTRLLFALLLQEFATCKHTKGTTIETRSRV